MRHLADLAGGFILWVGVGVTSGLRTKNNEHDSQGNCHYLKAKMFWCRSAESLHFYMTKCL